MITDKIIDILEESLANPMLEIRTFDAISNAIEYIKINEEKTKPKSCVIDETNRTRHCPSCGARILMADQKYCDECGQALTRNIQPAL